MKVLKLLLIIFIFYFGLTKAADIKSPLSDIPDINFIARSDYVPNRIATNTLLSHHLDALQGIRGDYLTSFALYNKSKKPADKANTTKYLIYTVVAEYIGEILFDYFKRSNKTIENLLLKNPEDILADSKRLVQLIGQTKLGLLQAYLNTVLDDNVLNGYDLLKTKKTSLINPLAETILYINEKTFMILNNYLKLVFEYGIFLLSNLNYDQKKEFYTNILQRVDAFKKAPVLNLYIELNILKDDISELDSKATQEESPEYKDQYSTLLGKLNIYFKAYKAQESNLSDAQIIGFNKLFKEINSNLKLLETKITETKKLTIEDKGGEPLSTESLLASLINLSSSLDTLSFISK